MEKIARIGMDTSKNVFQLHGVNEDEEPVLRRKLRRTQMIMFMSRLSPTVVGIEAGGAAHYWARTFTEMGHEVRIIAPQFVKPYVKRGKNDAADAEALCEAMNRPTMRFVPAKTAEQQAALMLVTIRDRLIRTRTQLTNAIRGYAAEFGLITSQGVRKVAPFVEQVAQDESLPDLARSMFQEMGDQLENLESRIRKLNAELVARHRQNEISQRLAQIPAASDQHGILRHGSASRRRIIHPAERTAWGRSRKPVTRPCAAFSLLARQL